MLSSNTTPRILALLEVVVSLALPILKSLKSGPVLYIEKISTISILYRDWVSAGFYTPRWILVGIVIIFAKGENLQERIWETHWFNGTIIYKTILENVLEFKTEDRFPVANYTFDIEITTVVNKCKVASVLSPYVLQVQVRKSKRKEKQACWSKQETASCRLWHQKSLGGWH